LDRDAETPLLANVKSLNEKAISIQLSNEDRVHELMKMLEKEEGISHKQSKKKKEGLKELELYHEVIKSKLFF